MGCSVTADFGNNADSTDLRAAATGLLSAIGQSGDFQMAPLVGGRNNRVFRIDLADQSAVLKWYFSHEDDQRNRLEAEFRFCQFCWANDILQVPRPLAADRARKLGLYEYIDGQRFGEDDVIDDSHVESALNFVIGLNQQRHRAVAHALPNAAEACFRVGDHLQCVDRRVARLAELDSSGVVDRLVIDLIQKRLGPRWREIRDSITSEWKGQDEAVTRDNRCLSPSDFGFHNALQVGDSDCDQRVRFLDFEYAGWDDPAKLVCDFFCQVEIPVPTHFWQPVVLRLKSLVDSPQSFEARCDSLLAAYRIKWACIVLNEFLPDHRARRQFSASNPLSEDQLAGQLAKSEALLKLTDN
jgi:hypothetical protein